MEYERISKHNYFQVMSTDRKTSGFISIPGSSIIHVYIDGEHIELLLAGTDVSDALTGMFITSGKSKQDAIFNVMKTLLDLGLTAFHLQQQQAIQKHGFSPSFRVKIEEE